MNAAVEFHDSQVVAVEHRADAVVVRLAAYVHRSDGRPGYNIGTGWTQEVEMMFASGVVEALFAELPCTLSDGRVSGGAEFAGMVPLPALVQSPVRFEALGQDGAWLVVRGAGLEVVAVAEAVYVEVFPGTKHSEP